MAEAQAAKRHERRHVALPVRPGSAFETQSGLQANWPQIYGVLVAPQGARHAVLAMHPASNFMNHYLLDPLAERGVAMLGLNSRYYGGDATLIMERVIQDLGAGVRYLREQGYRTVTLIGNSGGAALVSLYQAQAEKLTISDTPAGDPIDLRQEDLPPADSIALLAGHPGRGQLLTNYMDAAVVDERDPLRTDPEYDIYDKRNGPPFAAEFVARVRARQRARSDAITAWARARLAQLRAIPGGPRDEAFVVHRTYGDPRFVDITLDPNDRAPGGNRGDTPQQANLSPSNLGRFCTLTSWLSQWSMDTRASGPATLAQTSVPVLQLEYTADGGVFPSEVAAWSAAGGARVQNHRIVGATHYMKGQPKQLGQVTDLLAGWTAGLK